MTGPPFLRTLAGVTHNYPSQAPTGSLPELPAFPLETGWVPPPIVRSGTPYLHDRVPIRPSREGSALLRVAPPTCGRKRGWPPLGVSGTISRRCPTAEKYGFWPIAAFFPFSASGSLSGHPIASCKSAICVLRFHVGKTGEKAGVFPLFRELLPLSGQKTGNTAAPTGVPPSEGCNLRGSAFP